MTSTVFRGWYDRGYLPHYDTDRYPQFITYRLADSLPRHVSKRILRQTEDDAPERRRRFEKFLDRGYGSCVLRRSECAEIVVENLKFHAGKKYRLLDWVMMPNHVHVVYDRPTTPMKEILHSWKSYTSNKIRKIVGTTQDDEPLWQAGFYDRFARDAHHLCRMRDYIIFNPVKAGLVDDPFDWPYSSVHEHVEHRDSILKSGRQWQDRGCYT